MAAWFFFFLLLPFALIFHLQKKYRKLKNVRKPPGPPGLPFLGNLHQFDSAKPHEFLTKLSKKYGPLMSLRLGSAPVVVISSAKTAREALKTHDLVFSGRPSLAALQSLSYKGLDIVAAPYGEHWREMRKIGVIHLFSSKRVQSFQPAIADEVSLLIEKISDLSSSSQIINLSSMTLNLASTIICRIAFGKNYVKEGLEENGFDQNIRDSQDLLGGFFVSDYFPSLGWMDKLSGMLARLEKNLRDMDLFLQEVIEDHLNPNRPDTMKDDIVDVLIQIKDKQSSSIDLTWDIIKALLKDIFLAGTESSAITMVWALTSLMQNPSSMKRVQTEIRNLAGTRGEIGEEDVQQLPYLDAVIKETFRLYPPAPLLLPRETIGNCNIDGYEIEDKTRVLINAWAIARDPKTWENPEDFCPERFLNSKIDMKGNDFELIPFGAGRRVCPGMTLGLSAVKVSLANLLYSFDWELPLGMKIHDIDTDVFPGISLHKKTPLCLVAKKYSHT